MSKHRHKLKLKPVLYSILAFMLAFVLFAFSICMVLKTTIFSKAFITDCMSSSGYFSMLKNELTDEMKSLGNASGLDEEFAESFVDSLNLQKSVKDYISNFYSNESTMVETTSFKQQLIYAIDEYVKEKNISSESVSEENVDYFVNNAEERYINVISIPFFSFVGNYIFKSQFPLTIITILLGVFALAIIAVIFFTNSFKHRRFRYISYSFGGAFLSVTLIPLIVQISGKISQININTRSLYNLFVSYMNGLFMNFWIYSVFYLFIAFITFLLYRKYYKRAISD